MKKRRFKGLAGNKGVTLVELLVYIAVVSIVMLAIYEAFRNQQNSYLVQEGVAIMQQNLRGGMFMITNDIQMTGYYTSYDSQEFPFLIDFDGDTTNDTIRPLITTSGNDLVIMMADRQNLRALSLGESAKPSAVPPVPLQMDIENDLNLDWTFTPYGVLIKNDLSRAEFFRVTAIAPGAPDIISVVLPGNDFKGSYIHDAIDTTKSDFVARAQVVRYRVSGTIPPTLIRETFGTTSGSISTETIAEYISGMTIAFSVADDVVGEVWVGSNTSGTKPMPPTGDGKAYDERDLRRIQITLTGQITISPKLGSKTRMLTSTVKPRNMGLGTL